MTRKHLTDVAGVLGSGGLTNVATTHTLTSLTRGDGSTVATFTSSDPSILMSIVDASGNVLEVVLLTAWNSGTKAITIVRAQEGYTAIAHAGSLAVVCSVYPSDLGTWTAYTPAWTATSGSPAVGSGGSLTGEYCQMGDTVFFRLNLVCGSTGFSAGSGTWFFSLPVAHVAPPSGIGQHGVMVDGYIEDLGTRALASPAARLKASSTTLIELTYQSDAVGSANTIGPTTPFTWGNGDYLSIYGSYRAA